MNMIELLVLDMAGTTIDEDNVVYKTLMQAVNNQGYKVSLDEVLASCAGKEKFDAIETLLEELNGKKEDAEAIFKNFSEELRLAYQNLEVKPIKGVEDFLLKVRTSGKKVVLNTGYSSEIAQQLIKKLDWKVNVHFDAMITADDVTVSRPNPDMIFLAMKQFGISDAKKVLKAGDSAIDIEEGKNAGCGMIIGVLSGAQNRSELEKAKPDYIFERISDAENILF
ncbi:phosphonatase-like hydrolase [Chryseobacterium sp. JAH]|uniref:phosphonatase-like hydrolase n=1 Tax=Chryseobacterium sp. JAH TaxID=1742858 RepID=UPI0007413FF4|nr:phosphonatase-like hydrolase [Chryseobacterium sp. JAH]KUJ52537.1 HAD family hydrolase [Chryseobacterium sp. JAH]